jgi:DNA-binding transcriptional LysR family regulator
MPNPDSVGSWADMRVFLQVAYARSFNKAGKQLGTSHATVARAVRRLEATLRTQLLLAGARGIVLTPSGLRLAQGLAKLDAQISEIARRIAPQMEATIRRRSECDEASGAAAALSPDASVLGIRL